MHWKIGPSNGTPQPRSLINPILIGSNECLVTHAALCKYIRYNGFESGDRGLIVAQRSLKSVESINLFSRFPSATGFIPPPIVSKVRPIQLKRKTYFPKGLRLKINILRRGNIIPPTIPRPNKRDRVEHFPNWQPINLINLSPRFNDPPRGLP